MMQPSEEDRELATVLMNFAFRKGEHLYLEDALEIIALCRSHFSPIPPIDCAFGELEQELRGLGGAGCRPLADAVGAGAAGGRRRRAEEIAGSAKFQQLLQDTLLNCRKTNRQLQSQIAAIKGQAVSPVVMFGEDRKHFNDWQWSLIEKALSPWITVVTGCEPNAAELLTHPTFPPAEQEIKAIRLYALQARADLQAQVTLVEGNLAESIARELALQADLSLANQKLNELGAVVEGMKKIINNQDLYALLMNVQNEITSPADWSMANTAIIRIDNARANIASVPADILAAHDKQVEARVLREAATWFLDSPDDGGEGPAMSQDALVGAAYYLRQLAAERENGTGGTQG